MRIFLEDNFKVKIEDILFAVPRRPHTPYTNPHSCNFLLFLLYPISPRHLHSLPPLFLLTTSLKSVIKFIVVNGGVD